LSSLQPAEEFETVNAAPPASAFSAVVSNSQGVKTEQAKPQPAYALSVTTQPKLTVAPPIRKPMSPRTELKSTSLWAVQVAAMERKQDAEALAGVLRNKGYDAYVMEAEVDRKTWHRVRVGHSLARADAAKLQKTLQTAEKFGSAYMISRARKDEE
jgi:cell division septation protein DedD